MARIVKENVTVPVVFQSVGGDLRLKGREGTTLQLDGDGVDVEQIAEGQPYVIRVAGDCRAVIPAEVDLTLQSAGGDAKITDVRGDLHIFAVGGDLALRNTANAQVKSVGGDLRLKWAEGNVTVENVGSDATIREVQGAVWVANIGSDLFVRNTEGGCVVENVGSDLVVSMEFQPEHEYRFQAGSDILCRIHPETSARFVMPADTAVSVDVPSDVAETDDALIITIGEGSATVHMAVDEGGEIQLVGEEEDYMIDLGVQIEEELEARLHDFEEKVTQQLEGLDERIVSKAQQMAAQAEQFSERFQRQAQRTAERFSRRMARGQSKSKRKRGTSSWVPPRPPVPAQPTEPVSEEERLLIMRMVQENKITIEEAERLLAALDS